MKKVIEFMKQPYITTLLCAVGLTAGFAVGVGGKYLFDLQTDSNNKRKACKDAFDTMCVQVHACTGGSVSECDNIVKENDMCNVNLPDLQVIYNCKEELRNIECSDNMPASCVMFME